MTLESSLIIFLIERNEKMETNYYHQFISWKKKTHIPSGFKIELSDMNDIMFLWQQYLTRYALHAGKFALFEDCGLGKTVQQ